MCDITNLKIKKQENLIIPKLWIFFLAGIIFIIFLWICRPSGLYFLADDFQHVPWAVNGKFFTKHWLRPLSNISIWLDGLLFHFSYVGFYLTNLVLHLLNSILIFFLAQTLFKRNLPYSKMINIFPLYASLFFLVFPSHTESIFWIVGRGASLVAIFMQLALIFYLKDKSVYKVLSYICFGLALFTYELSWALPFIVTLIELYDRIYFKKRKSLVSLIIYWVFFLVYMLFRFFYLNKFLSNYEASNFINLNFPSLGYNFFTSIARVFTPPFQNSIVFSLLTIGVFFILFLLTVRLFRKERALFVFIFFCFICICICLFPVMSIGSNTHTSEGERFIYSASVFFCILLAAFFCSFKMVKVHIILFPCILILQLLFFYKSSLNYRYAGYVSKYIISEVNKLPVKDSLEIFNLPTEHNGALLFRNGFPLSAKGLMNKEFKVISVVSFSEILQRKDYKTIYIMLEPLTNKAIFKFSSDTLYIYK